MNIADHLTEARLNAEAAETLIADDVVQRRLFGSIGLAALIAIPYTAYRLVRGLVKIAH